MGSKKSDPKILRMINQLLVEEIFLSPLCIDSKYAQALAMSAYMAYTSNKPLANSRFVSSYRVNASTGQKLESTEPDSVGIVVIDGPIVTNSDSWYGIKGTLEAAQELLALEADPNVIGTVLYLETGGGAVYALKPIVDVLNSLTKPVVTFSKQILASAGYRIAANTDYIMMYHPQGIVGSLGTMSSFSDMQPMFEKWGMKFFEYYATESTLKNKTFNDAKAGDGKALITNILDPMNNLFLSDIKALRGDKLDKKEKAIYQGETFMPDPQGIQLGLVDSMGTLGDAIAMVRSLANGETPSSINSNFKTSNTMWPHKKENKLNSLTALIGLEASAVTAAHVEAANKEIVAENIPGVTLVLDSDLEKLTADAAAGKPAELTAANAKVTKLEGELATANTAKTTAETAKTAAETAKTTAETKITTLQAELATANARIVELGGKPAADATAGTVEPGNEPAPGEGVKANAFYSEADAELAQARGKMGFVKPAAAAAKK